MRIKTAAVIGFGEAGPVFASGLLKAGLARVSAYDVLMDDPVHAPGQRTKTEALGVEAAADTAAAVDGADLILSTVTADQTVRAAQAAAPHLRIGQTYLDLNSTSPKIKAVAAAAVEASGAAFVEGAAMDTVPNFGAQVPILVAGPTAAALAERLNQLGMRLDVAGDEFGAASTAKMLRSVLIKGFAALFAESMQAAGKLGLQQRVIASLGVTFPGLDWEQVIGYYLGRSALHARRQAAEMRDAAETVADLGVDPLMTVATAKRLQKAADLELVRSYRPGASPSVEDYLRAIDSAGP